jgi:hypothetical protein
MQRNGLNASIFGLVVLCGPWHASGAAAIDDITLQVSTDICDGSNPADNSYVIYAQNTNTARVVNANFSYDSNPSGQTFPMFDSSMSPVTDRFPKNHNTFLQPGSRVAIGCTINYRASAQPRSYTPVPVVVTKAGAAYVDPATPEPTEQALGFVGFYSQVGFSACTGGSLPPGLIYVVNLHPYKRLQAAIALAPQSGKPPPPKPDTLNVDLKPLMVTRAGCSNGFLSPTGVLSARFPDQKQSKHAKASH